MNFSATVLSAAEDKAKCGGQPQPKTKSYFKPIVFKSPQPPLVRGGEGGIFMTCGNGTRHEKFIFISSL
jgi:hypothetical protein